MPPLRLRGNDVVLLAEHFLERFARENHKRVDGFTDAARAKIGGHRWPGNVRELENAVERAVVMLDGERIDADDLPFEGTPQTFGSLRIPGATMAELERHAILRTIQYRLHQYGAASSRTPGKA